MSFIVNELNLEKKILPKPEEDRTGWPWDISTSLSRCDKNVCWPKISIVTPSFNQGKFIEETIRSVVAQNYPNLEYIIIDGGSTDETVDIIKKYEPWISYWISEPDNGQSHAINKGLDRCTGDIFNWLNSDDWYMSNSLFEVATQFINNPSVKVVSGFENHLFEDGTTELCKGTFLEDTLEATIEWCQIAQPSTFFRMNILKEIAPIPEDMHYIMDGEIWVRFLLMYGQKYFLKISQPLVNFRLHEGSKTVSNAVENNFLYERSSIITDLQRFVGLPTEVINFWSHHVYKTPKLLNLNRKWEVNENIISKRKLRIYFLRKYVNHHFHHRNIEKAKWGTKQLLLNIAFDYFMFKSLIKIGIRAISE
ncbi:glycosyltransferase family 2 protein [Pontibacter locisalis]|uniref:Glycosyltransferase family 2 protein n=1 Tax=Pontibacter locisalis TaxID=1719035 RepID=A0ABW5IRG6_9BACT